MHITPLSQETTVACLNGVKETKYKLSDQDLSLLSSHLMRLVGQKLTAVESTNNGEEKQALLDRLDYPDR